MRDVFVNGIGLTRVGEHWEDSLRKLATQALHQAMSDAKVSHLDALYIGNGYSPTFSSQNQLGALVADHAGLSGIEALTMEAGDASGGAAIRAGYLAVASGLVDTVAVVGVEKSTDMVASAHISARSISLDADVEAIHGMTLTATAALLMRRYMHENQVSIEAFEGFSINAHRNGNKNPSAMFRNTLRDGAYAKAAMISDPINLFDGAPDADGSAAVILSSKPTFESVRIAGSSAATDTMALHDRENLLHFNAVSLSTNRALKQANMALEDIDVFELHDMYTIFTTLSLEALGLADSGKGWRMAERHGRLISLDGDYPISTFGGLKARGNPVGATGVYQAVEAVMQLKQQAGDNQVNNAQKALIQNLGGAASTCITHILTTI
jgi:acetyl-CoA C-acetyltransferase